MYTFLSGIALLIIGYFTYGKFIEKLFGIKPNRPTPAYVNSDGVDFVPMNVPKNSLIQLLNIAGTARTIEQIREHFEPSKMVLLGVNPADIRLPIQFPSALAHSGRCQ